MAFGFRKRKQSEPSGTPGKSVYAVGDIHGRLDALEAMLSSIIDHQQKYSSQPAHLIFLGDLIDRGPHSRKVLEKLIGFKASNLQCHFIMGNHEEALVRGLSGETNLLEPWLKHGGYETAESYGVERGLLIGQPEHVLEHTLLSAIPSDHIRFMSEFLDSINFGDYLFVHAGIRPGVPLSQQTSQDMKWIRKDFLESDVDFGCIVVHGHTIHETIQEKPNRIGLDTGAYKSGILSAIWIEGNRREFLQVTCDPCDDFST